MMEQWRIISRAVSAALLLAGGVHAQAPDSLPERTRAPVWAARGAVAGSLVGVTLGGLLGAGLCDAADCSKSASEGAAYGLVAGAAAGAFVGWVTGSFKPDVPAGTASARSHAHLLAGASGLDGATTSGWSAHVGIGRRNAMRTSVAIEAGYGRLRKFEESIRYQDGNGGFIESVSRSQRQFAFATLVSDYDLATSASWRPLLHTRLGLYRGWNHWQQTQRSDSGAVPDWWQDRDETNSGFGWGGGIGLGVRTVLGESPVKLTVTHIGIAGAELDLGGFWELSLNVGGAR